MGPREIEHRVDGGKSKGGKGRHGCPSGVKRPMRQQAAAGNVRVDARRLSVPAHANAGSVCKKGARVNARTWTNAARRVKHASAVRPSLPAGSIGPAGGSAHHLPAPR